MALKSIKSIIQDALTIFRQKLLSDTPVRNDSKHALSLAGAYNLASQIGGGMIYLSGDSIPSNLHIDTLPVLSVEMVDNSMGRITVKGNIGDSYSSLRYIEGSITRNYMYDMHQQGSAINYVYALFIEYPSANSLNIKDATIKVLQSQYWYYPLSNRVNYSVYDEQGQVIGSAPGIIGKMMVYKFQNSDKVYINVPMAVIQGRTDQYDTKVNLIRDYSYPDKFEVPMIIIPTPSKGTWSYIDNFYAFNTTSLKKFNRPAIKFDDSSGETREGSLVLTDDDAIIGRPNIPASDLIGSLTDKIGDNDGKLIFGPVE